MRNVLAIAKREFRSAFDLPIAYVFIATFLVLAALLGLVGYFDRGVADLRDYFAGLRYAFVLFAPAVAMRLWAEERRSRTFELLFTLPLKPWEAVIGKFLGALGLVIVAVLLGAALPITLSQWGSFDPGAVFSGYLGVVLLAAAEIALGLLVSALTDNQIVAFVGASVASLLLLVAGEPAVLAEAERFSVAESLLSAKKIFIEVLSRLGTGEHQEGLARGVLDTRDLVYFAAITGVFLLANVIAVERRRGRIEALVSLVLALAGFFLVEDLATRRHARFDLTAKRAFSLNEATKTTLRNIEARLTVRLYLSRELPAGEEREKRELLDLLHEIEAQGGKNVRLEVYDPTGDERLVEQAGREGVTSITHQHMSQESSETKIIWCGVSLLYAGKPPLAIPLALRKPNLEYDLAVAIRKLAQKQPQRVAWIEPAEQKASFEYVRQELGRSYTVESLDLKARQEVPKDFQTAVLVLDEGAVGTLGERELYILDQFLMRGGALVVLIEPMNADLGQLRARPIAWGRVGEVMKRWGLFVPPRLVLALSPQMIGWRLPSRAARGGAVGTNAYAYFVEPHSQYNLESPVAAQISRGLFPFVGEVVATAGNREGTTTTLLLRTAPGAWMADGEIDLDPMRIPVPPRREARTIGAAISGAIPSAFESPVLPSRPGADPLGTFATKTAAGRLIVFGDTDFVKDSTYQMSRGEGFAANLNVFLNTIDWATEDAGLATMRTRNVLQPLEATDRSRAVAWGVNLIGMPLLVGMAGVARFLLRRRAGRQAAEASRKGAA